MTALPDWLLYVGALILVVVALRLAGGVSRSRGSATLQARVRKKQRLKRKAAQARGETSQVD